MPRFCIALLMTITVGPALETQERDATDSRPPLILNTSRTERLEALVRLYLQGFIGAIRWADTAALGVLAHRPT